MARDGLRVFVCAGLLLLTLPRISAAPGDESDGREARLRTQLAVQNALQQGLDQMQRGNYQAAVYALESQVARINGDRTYLNALRDAYRGYLEELKRANRRDEIPTYSRRLAILDPGTHLETAPAPAPPARSSALAAPAAQVRAKGPDEDDPFGRANSKQAQEARALVDRAEQEFQRRRYAEAGRFYEEARRADPDALAACRDHWLYCRLATATETLNRLRPGDAAAAELEEDVRQVLALAPPARLETAARDLLRKVQERGKPAEGPARIEVRHVPARRDYFAIAETTNFRIYHRKSREYAEKVARIAEATRTAVTRKWFGETPGPWDSRCEVFLYDTAQDYARGANAYPQAPGHSTYSVDGDRITRRMDLRCDAPNLLTGVLPHETTHVTLFGHFNKRKLPQWADEAMAVLSEPRDLVELHLRNLPMHRRNHELFKVADLLPMPGYPNPRYIGAFYAQSVSLVDYLCRQKGPRAFARFMGKGLARGDYEGALRDVYGIAGSADLERRWRKDVFGD